MKIKTTSCNENLWNDVLQYVSHCAIEGKVGFPTPPTVNTIYPLNLKNIIFTDGNKGWKQE